MGCAKQTQRLTLVLLPGMDGTGELFADFAAALDGRVEITMVRYPTEQIGCYSELENVVREACPVSGSFVILAESYSTPLAIKYAALNPARLKGLVICCGFAKSPLRGWTRLLMSVVAPVIFHLPLCNFIIERWLVGRGASSSLLVAVRTVIASVAPKVLTERLRAVLTCDVSRMVPEIRIPMMYIRAEQDRLIKPLCASELKKLNPSMTITGLCGPHLLLQRHPQSAAATVLGFVNSICF